MAREKKNVYKVHMTGDKRQIFSNSFRSLILSRRRVSKMLSEIILILQDLILN